ncbi:hypothetical protein [Formosa algae]|uniref:Uncharacterized protein n=1 Tax=Formosa algae TaxID=225843 RepID=A0A9X0YLQ2_9FLAO|nr:hypothetical protein [Formosa algae]MBP1839519.1 hypothetical protein [Formosa algae]MDQ0334823.1 hypothetical protein [Formosa algae]
MKKFLKLFLFFCVPVLVLGCTMEYLLRHIPNEFQIKSDYLKTNTADIKTLLVGSSHILYGINPEFLTEKALNYGNISQTIDIDYDIIHQYINELPALETVVLRLSYTTLFEQLKTGDESWRIKNYAIYTGVNVDADIKHHFEIFSVKFKNNLERLYTYYILKETPDYVNPSGWGTHKAVHSVARLETLGELIAKKHTASHDDLYVENLGYLKKIVSECKEKNIDLLLVTLPAYGSYVNNLDSLQWKRTLDSGNLMDKTYENCVYFNVLNTERFGKQYFIDVDHLNVAGAEKFSKIIDSLLTQ